VTEFALRVVALSDDAVLVTVEGAVRAHDAEEVRRQVAEAAAAGVHRVVVEASEATMADVSGLSALYDVALMVRPRGGVVALVLPRAAALRRIILASGLEPAFTLYESRSAALDDLGLDDPPA